MNRREFLPEFYDSIVAVSIDAIVDDGIEEQQGIGPSRNFPVFAHRIEAFAKGSGRGQVSMAAWSSDH